MQPFFRGEPVLNTTINKPAWSTFAFREKETIQFMHHTGLHVTRLRASGKKENPLSI